MLILNQPGSLRKNIFQNVGVNGEVKLARLGLHDLHQCLPVLPLLPGAENPAA